MKPSPPKPKKPDNPTTLPVDVEIPKQNPLSMVEFAIAKPNPQEACPDTMSPMSPLTFGYNTGKPQTAYNSLADYNLKV